VRVHGEARQAWREEIGRARLLLLLLLSDAAQRGR
jgi:hypothetical protein